MKTRILALVLCILVLFVSFPVNAENVMRFKDLNESHWAYQAVMDMVGKGIINGFEDETFRPNTPVTREQFAKMLVLALGLAPQSPANATFADVPKDGWAYSYIEAVKKYLTGYKIGDYLYFRGDQPAVREDMAVAIVAAKGLHTEQPDLSLLANYTDKDKITPSLKGFVAIAIKNKVMEGSENKFNPQSTLTRAEACALIYKSGISAVREEKVPVISQDKTTGSRIYNDGYITFEYPAEFEFKPYNKDTLLNQHPEYPFQIAEFNGIRINIFYTTDPNIVDYRDSFSLENTTLDGVLNRLNEGAFASFNKQKLQNSILLDYSDQFGDKKMIFGRGIGTIIPRVQISGKEKYSGGVAQAITEQERQCENALIKPIAEMISKSFSVVSSKPPLEVPAVAPKVVSTTPADGATNVPVNSTEIRIVFSKPVDMDPLCIDYYDDQGNRINDVSKGGSYFDRTWIVAVNKLKPATKYRIKVSDVKDKDGRVIEPYSFSFTTAAQ
ncbi:MAG: S-layer homology domain-containing protein [Clostridia bacterium]|nr:S-layer homology domain-containing protein [Clostridia bacterium]